MLDSNCKKTKAEGYLCPDAHARWMGHACRQTDGHARWMDMQTDECKISLIPPKLYSLYMKIPLPE